MYLWMQDVPFWLLQIQYMENIILISLLLLILEWERLFYPDLTLFWLSLMKMMKIWIELFLRKWLPITDIKRLRELKEICWIKMVLLRDFKISKKKKSLKHFNNSINYCIETVNTNIWIKISWKNTLVLPKNWNLNWQKRHLTI